MTDRPRPFYDDAAAARRELQSLVSLLASDEYNEGGDLTNAQMEQALSCLDHDIAILASYEDDAQRWMQFRDTLLAVLHGYRRKRDP